MTSFTPDTATRFSPALLALKRFARGTLQQLGIGLTALLIVLNLGTSTPAPSTVQPAPQASAQNLNTAKNDPSHSLKSTSDLDRTQPAQVTVSPALMLEASMTQHHLTRARLIIPITTERPVVSMAEEK